MEKEIRSSIISYIACSLILLGILTGFSVYAVNPLQVTSPDGQLVFSFHQGNSSISYSVNYKGKAILGDSPISLQFKDSGEFGAKVSVQKPIFKLIDETYELVVGKTRHARSFCNELIIPLLSNDSYKRHINFVVRAYNDGLAFRYEFPQQDKWKSFILTEESTVFNLEDNPKVLALLLPNYTTSHEGLYTAVSLEELRADTLMDMPVLFDCHGAYMAITEAALDDYAGMYLTKHDGHLESRLSPLPGQTEIKVKATLPHKSPWRVMLISDRVGDLFESNILTSLNEPCKIKDVSWIKPGKATWPWWNGTVVADSTVLKGNNFETNKYYIDFCARNGIEYHSVVEYGGHEWYVNNGSGYQPGTEFDVTLPVEGLDMQKVCDYGRSKGVGIRLWVHWAALYPKLEAAFTLYEKWGIAGLMVDFMDSDDQEMVNLQNEILQRAAIHHLHIQFHGAYKPTGMHRTYPNEFTREGTLNYEVNKWAKKVTPDHDLNIVFTRLLAGATDYHLGGFRAVTEDNFVARNDHPFCMGTRCHMLAMYVVLESYLSMVCDYPEAYEGQPGFEFICKVPTSWDETKVLSADVSQLITIARRKGTDWFLGSLTNHESREVTISFDFLTEGKYTAEIYSDSPETEINPNLLERKQVEITPADQTTLKLASGGGQVMIIRKVIENTIDP
ncbi:MAG TPA: glycoside hydrolase [Prolixibacteraceae bacterium]|jgi:alpha-glucosidase|nr:glycoside hydrolase [Prolixibacteraceae bacterium]